jgi:hypothetical protein
MTRHPEYRVARHISAPPDAVLAAIRDAIDGTKRGDIPPHLQRGVRGMGGMVSGTRFTVGLDHVGEGGDHETDLVGMVLPREDGGSDVRASVLDSHGAPIAVLVLLGIAGVFALLGIGAFAWVAVGFAALIALAATFRDATGFIDHDEAAFLVEWLNGVLHPLAAAGAGAALDEAGRVSPSP